MICANNWATCSCTQLHNVIGGHRGEKEVTCAKELNKSYLLCRLMPHLRTSIQLMDMKLPLPRSSPVGEEWRNCLLLLTQESMSASSPVRGMKELPTLTQE